MALRNATALLALIALLAGSQAVGQPAPVVPPPPDVSPMDRNRNGISDLLDSRLTWMDATTVSQVEVTLSRPVTARDLAVFRQLGGTVDYVCTAVANSITGFMPLGATRNVPAAFGPGFYFLDCAVPTKWHLDVSSRTVRVRQDVWTRTYGAPAVRYEGTATTRVAILDTGIDDSHTDITAARIAAWTDTTTDATASAVDYVGHGTHVTGIALGTGASYGAGARTTMTHTQSGQLYTYTSWAYDPIVLSSGGTDNVTGSINTLENPTAGVYVGYDPTFNYEGPKTTPPASSFAINGDSGRGQILETTTTSYNPLHNFSTVVTYPYTLAADTFNWFRGMAPGCQIVGVKIFLNTGTGWSTDMGEGLDWVVANRSTRTIKVASMSAGISGTDTALRAKAQAVMENGVVMCISAGNDYPTYTIFDPALATKVITVGATNDDNAMCSYSSNGASGSGKPDCVAPGGSWDVGSGIYSADTNDSDAGLQAFADRNANDYTNYRGTSMATPLVAGICGILVQAYEQTVGAWPYTEAAALSIKNVLLATCRETNVAGESGNTPSLNRGAKDLVEGYGRICPDAALSAMIDQAPIQGAGETGQSTTFGSGTTDRKAWAQHCHLERGKQYFFNMTVPSGCDADLYLYDDTPDANGNPVIVLSSTTATTAGNKETFTRPVITPGSTAIDTYYLVAKLVSGTGTVSITNIVIITPAKVSGLRGVWRDGRPTLTWTVAERGLLAGFNVYSTTDPKRGTWVLCTDKPITTGAKKVAWHPQDLHPGETKYYRLESVDAYGGKTDHGFVKLTAPRR
jgi:Subtilase family